MEEISSELWNRVLRLTPVQQRLFASDCAEHVLPFFENFCPHDDRPRIAIETAWRFAAGTAGQSDLDHARGAAESAAWEAGAAAWSGLPEGIEPPPAHDAAAPTAIVAEGCCVVSIETAVLGILDTAIETVVTAVVGSYMADTIWRTCPDSLDPETAQRYRDADVQERAWQQHRIGWYE